MSMNFTDQQKKAIDCRNAGLIVSAAAGAGKTAVLVQRILGLLTDREHPCGVDELLVVTFTNAAAGELRQRLATLLREQLAREPENTHLRRQLSLLGSARIQTVHAFCQSLIREHFTLCGVEPDFRLADETQCELLLEQALNDTLEAAYEAAEPGFLALCETLTDGRSDQLLSRTVTEIFHRLSSHPYPDRLLALLPELCAREPQQLAWMKEMQREAAVVLFRGLEALDNSLRLARDTPEIWKSYGAEFTRLSEYGHRLQEAARQGWDEARACLDEFDKGRLSACRYQDKALLERVKAGREAFFRSVAALREQYYFQSLEAIRREGQRTAPMVEALCRLVAELSERFSQEKLRRGLLDFSDLEHYALRLLSDPRVGEPLRAQLREVLVDEYQDTNDIQEEIFSLLRKPGDPAFFVGDIKQSIYRFRLAEPALFADRYDRSIPYTGTETGEVRLSLNRNFRSRPEVLSLCNAVMARIMSRAFGDVEYDEDQQLYAGRKAEGTAPSEVLLLDCAGKPIPEEDEEEAGEDAALRQESRPVLEARLVARRVQRLLREEQVPDGVGGYRAARPEDVAILLSSFAGKAPVYRAELQRLGIPCGQGGGEFFGTVETATLLSLLRLLVNRRQDIPLVSLLRSPLYLVPPETLARLRLVAPEGDLIDGLTLAAANDPLCARVLADLDRWQEESLELPLSRLVRLIYDQTGAEQVFSVLDNGPRRLRNLHRLEELCRPFDGGAGGLAAFLRWIDRKAQEGLPPEDSAPEGEGVRLLSIHRSKGLEWPFVILPDLSKRFNTDDLSRPVLFHPHLGIGLRLRDRENRTETRTQLQQAITARTRRELKSEEVRKLYVAMTRAREKLILVMSVRDLDRRLQKVAQETGGLPTPQWLAERNDAMSWLLAALLTHPACGELRQRAGVELPVGADSRAEELICRILTPEELRETPETLPQTEKKLEAAASDPDYAPLLAKSREQYAHMAAASLPSKVTPTGLRTLAPESGQLFGLPDRAQARDHQPRALAQPDPQALLRGTAMHILLRRADLAACTSEKAVLAQADRLAREGFLTPEERELVWPEPILLFAQSELGSRTLTAERVLREQEFSLLLDAGELLEDGPAGERLLLNGAIDLLLFEPEGLTVVDFKTDRVAPGREAAQAQEHALQLALYARAAEELYARPVREKWVWFLRRGQGVRLA